MSFEVQITSSAPVVFSGVVEAASYNYSEESSPLSGADSSGSVGTFSVTMPVPPSGVPESTRPIWVYERILGDSAFVGATVQISDDRKGFTSGTVSEVSRSQDQGMITLSGVTRMGLMNIFNIQAAPFNGNLNGAIGYYLGLAGITTGFTVDTSIATTPVSIPGWNGELWLHLKQLASAYACDISLVSNVILVRPVREREASTGRDITRSASMGGYSLAQAVEIYQYNNRQIVNQPVYPWPAPALEDRMLSVNAGEYQEYTLELSSSLSTFTQPTMLTDMTLDYTASSAYVISGNEGTVITPGAWTAGGGSVTFELAPSTQAIIVKMYGPTNMTSDTGDAITSFSFSLQDPDTENRFSTLRIRGSGVAFTRVKKRIRTGVPASMAGTDVGMTIDNPFVSSANDVARVGLRAARQFSGTNFTLSGTVLSINRRGDSGQVSQPTWQQVQNAITAAIGGTPTYLQVQNYHNSLGLNTYEKVQDYWNNFFADPDVDQVFGNVQGARVWDPKTRRYFRIRSASLTPEGIAFDNAEDDLTYGDYQTFNAGLTYAQVQAKLAGLTYRRVEMAGLY